MHLKISNIRGTVDLKNGVPMPYFGLGVFQVHDGEEVIQAVKDALSAGYRHIEIGRAHV